MRPVKSGWVMKTDWRGREVRCRVVEPAVYKSVARTVWTKGRKVKIHKPAEYSYVVEGKMGALLGEEVVFAEVGDLVFKPRGQWHTFWNATDRPARLLEIISPAGFEQLFVELDELLRTDPENVAAASALGAKYGLESDQEATARVAAEHGLIEGPR